MHELHGHFLEDMTVGMTEIYSRTVTEAEQCAAFPEASVAVNPTDVVPRR